MPQRRVTVTSPSGLHARPASLFTKAAAQSGYAIEVGRDESQLVDAASILSVMSLGIKQGEEIVLSASAVEAEEALDALVALVSADATAAAH